MQWYATAEAKAWECQFLLLELPQASSMSCRRITVVVELLASAYLSHRFQHVPLSKTLLPKPKTQRQKQSICHPLQASPVTCSSGYPRTPKTEAVRKVKVGVHTNCKERGNYLYIYSNFYPHPGNLLRNF